jgi:hypothetical protein
MMALSPAEALGTYNGLAIAGILQQSLLVWIPRLTLFYAMIRTTYAFRQGADSAATSLLRLMASIGILAIFWPGAVFNGGGQAVSPSQFVSAAAQADGAPIQTAAQTPTSSQVSAQTAPIGVIPLTIVEFLSEGWLNAALAVRQQALKPFSSTLPLEWLLSQGVSAGHVGAIRDWSEKCILPAQRKALEAGAVPTFQNMLPFSGTPVADAMGGIIVMPGRLYGTLGAFSPFVGGPIPCSQYGASIVSGVEGELASLVTPAGTPITSIWEEEVGVDGPTAAQALIMREVLRTMQIVPAPSLRGAFLVASGTKMLGDGASAAVRGFLAGGPKGAAVAAGTAAAGNQLTAAADAVLGLVGPALMVTEFAPDLLGMAMTVMLSGMPILLCYLLVPGRQAILTPLVAYFVVLALLYSSPFWWAVIELTSASAAETSAGLMTNPMGWAKAKVAGLLYQTVGIGIVIVGLGTVMSMAAGMSGVSIVRSIRRPV